MHSIILDGEMLGYNPLKQVYRTKNQNMEIKALTSNGFLPCFFAFDIVMLNGEMTFRKKFSERNELLKSLIKPIKGKFEIAVGGEIKSL